MSVSVRQARRPQTKHKQAEPPCDAQTATLTLEKSEHPELVYEDESVFSVNNSTESGNSR